MGWQGEERRRHSRIIFPCKLAVGSPIRWLASHVENISSGGINVILDERLNIYTQVSIEIFFEKDKSVKCEGRVSWVEEMVNPIDLDAKPVAFITGIEFTDIEDYDKKYISSVLKLLSFRDKK